MSVIIVFVFIFLFLSPTLDGTLTKSDKTKKAKAPKRESISTTTNTKKKSSSQEAGAGLTYSDVIQNYNYVDYLEQKKFPNAVLAYITPWNNHGYDIAKWLAHKFTHIAPVWFQIVPLRDQQPPTCTIEGTHDLDQGWLNDVRKNNSKIKIVPRFLFEKWSVPEYQRMFADELEQERCAKVVIEFLERNRFDGAVIEIWVQLMSMSQGAAAKDLVHLVINWAEMFSQKSKQFILPVPPPLDAGQQNTGIFTWEHFLAVSPYVTYINIMTYDYPDRKIGPVSPIDWMRSCIESVISNHPDAAHIILMGMNFYGHEQTSKTSSFEAVTSNRYIDLLKSKKPEIHWHRSAAEHYLQMGDHVVFYPSLASIEARIKLAKELNVGIGIWDAGQGLDYFLNLF